MPLLTPNPGDVTATKHVMYSLYTGAIRYNWTVIYNIHR